MITVADIIWIVLFFVAIIIILILMRPSWLLKRDPLTGRLMDEIQAGKLLGWALLFTIIFSILLLLYHNHMGRRNINY